MTLPGRLRDVLSPDAAETWERIAPIVPEAAYLGGGTAIAVHIHHRQSRDLDFFYHENALDLDALHEALSKAGPFAVTQRLPGTLAGICSATNLQFLHADAEQPQRMLEQPAVVAGLRVAGLTDLMAMKVKVIAQRGELRDYFDLMAIEQSTGHTVEEGLSYFLARFQPTDASNQVMAVIRALGYLDDVDEDELLPAGRSDIARYWQRRQPEVLKSAGLLTSGGRPPPPPDNPVDFPD